MIVDLNEEELSFLTRVCDRAVRLAWMSNGATDFLNEPWSWVKDKDKAEALLDKLKAANNQ